MVSTQFGVFFRQTMLLTNSVAFVNENWWNIVVNEPLSRDENEMRRNVNACHVTMTIIECIMQYCWWIKTRLNVVYIIKTMLKCLHFRWPKRDETKCYNVISSRLVALLLLFCSISVSCVLQGCQVFAKKPAQLLLKTSPKLAQLHFEGGSHSRG